MMRLNHRIPFLLLLLFAVSPVWLRAQEATPGLYERPVLVLDPGVHTAPIRRADVDAAGRLAVTGSDDKTVRVWSLEDGRLLRTIRLPQGPGNVGKVYAVAISPDGAVIAAGGWTRCSDADPQEQIYLFDAATGAMIGRIEGLPNVVNHLAFSPDGRRLAATLVRRRRPAPLRPRERLDGDRGGRGLWRQQLRRGLRRGRAAGDDELRRQAPALRRGRPAAPDGRLRRRRAFRPCLQPGRRAARGRLRRLHRGAAVRRPQPRAAAGAGHQRASTTAIFADRLVRRRRDAVRRRQL